MSIERARPRVIIRRREVERRTGLSRSSIYARLKRNPRRPADYDPTFPRPIPIGAKAVGWDESEIEAWLETRAAARTLPPPSEPQPSRTRRATTAPADPPRTPKRSTAASA
jgi:prophage regulatory protein